MVQHVKILGWLHIVFGSLGILLGICGLVFFGGLAGFAAATSPGDSATAGAAILGIIGVVLLVIALVLSVPGLIAGIGLLNFRPWARILAIVISALDLLHVPFGTMLGIYGLWVLLSPQTEALFQSAPVVRSQWGRTA